MQAMLFNQTPIKFTVGKGNLHLLWHMLIIFNSDVKCIVKTS